MPTKVITWNIVIEDIETQSRVGIWDHERALQPLRISISMMAIAPVFPEKIEDCLNYEPVCRWISDEWPRCPHTPLLETRVRELMDFIFTFDRRIEAVDVAILKLTAIPQARAVGIKLALSRSDYDTSFGSSQPLICANENLSNRPILAMT